MDISFLGGEKKKNETLLMACAISVLWNDTFVKSGKSELSWINRQWYGWWWSFTYTSYLTFDYSHQHDPLLQHWHHLHLHHIVYLNDPLQCQCLYVIRMIIQQQPKDYERWDSVIWIVIDKCWSTHRAIYRLPWISCHDCQVHKSPSYQASTCPMTKSWCD